MSAAVPRALRNHIAAQANYRCGYCRSDERNIGVLMEVDHIVPRSLGGPTEESNLRLACSPCNRNKSDRIAAPDPATGERGRLFDPRGQIWTEHFAWSANGERIAGLTPTGRATVAALRLNRHSLVRARRR